MRLRGQGDAAGPVGLTHSAKVTVGAGGEELTNSPLLIKLGGLSCPGRHRQSEPVQGGSTQH